MNITQFNARNASAKQIAETFVVPDYFQEVTDFRNIVLVGPRGIGKTTLLKAITSSGLLALHRRSDLADILAAMDFDYVPIYIPAESIWKGTAGLVKQTYESSDDQNLILGGLFTDHCLYQLITSFEESASLKRELKPNESHPWILNINDAQEAKIASLCSDNWGFSETQKSFLGLKLQLLNRSNLYRSAISQNVGEGAIDVVRNNGHRDFLIMLRMFMDITLSVAGVNRWTISFDEMEIAPKHILSHLYENLRSFDQRAALKFSLFPFVDFYEEKGGFIPGTTSPVDGQDFHPVILSNKFSDPDYGFAKRLIQSECEKRGRSFGELKSYLNRSSGVKTGTRIYKDSGFERQPERIFRESAAQGDRSFKFYMAKKGINNEQDIKELTGEAQRAQIIRKVFPIAEIRSYYLSSDYDGKNIRRSTKVRRVSAKGYGYYHGFEQLLSLTEGNPRAIKYYLNELIPDMVFGKDSRVSQNSVIPRNVDRFRALVASQSVVKIGVEKRDASTLSVLDAMGHLLSENLLSSDFHPEPALSFELKNVAPSIREAVISAINSGALVVEQHSSGKRLLFDLEGCRVRLSHRLAPFYKLPTISGQSRILSQMPETERTYNDQPDLLAWALPND